MSYIRDSSPLHRKLSYWVFVRTNSDAMLLVRVDMIIKLFDPAVDDVLFDMPVGSDLLYLLRLFGIIFRLQTMGLSDLLYGKNALRYHIVPVVFVVIFTVGTEILMIWSHDSPVSMRLLLSNLKGDCSSWAITMGFYLWAWLSIVTSSKIHYGPETAFGFKPRYADNGFTYFLVTMAVFLAIQGLIPSTSQLLYQQFPKIIGTSTVLGLIFCFWLFIKGKLFREYKGDVTEPAPAAYEFYRGIELHPRVLGADVKQFTNCRVGMMAWPIFLTAFFIHSTQIHGFNAGIFMHYLLQLIYVAKFYWWETGYFHTIDMMVDRAGYYLCWGCLAFLPGFFCFPAALVIIKPPTLSNAAAFAIGGLGLALTALEYCIDQQKFDFRRSWPNKPYKIWGKPASFIVAEYTDNKGQRKKSPLLQSGFWGMARHLNYTVEIIIAFTISATLGFDNGIYTFAYFIFILPLVAHRILRDDQKCSAKYGKYWKIYKKQVKYVLIPGIL